MLLELKRADPIRKTVAVIEEDNKNVQIENKLDMVCFVKKYKPVTLEVKPVLGTLLEKFRIIKNIIGNLLEGILRLLEKPSEFELKEQYLIEKKEKLDTVYKGDFLWLEKYKLMH